MLAAIHWSWLPFINVGKDADKEHCTQLVMSATGTGVRNEVSSVCTCNPYLRF